jgi:hypothetical protein
MTDTDDGEIVIGGDAEAAASAAIERRFFAMLHHEESQQLTAEMVEMVGRSLGPGKLDEIAVDLESRMRAISEQVAARTPPFVHESRSPRNPPVME